MGAIKNNVVAGWDFSLYRYATVDELNTLLSHAGVPSLVPDDSPYAYSWETTNPVEIQPLKNLFDLIGTTRILSHDIYNSDMDVVGQQISYQIRAAIDPERGDDSMADDVDLICNYNNIWGADAGNGASWVYGGGDITNDYTQGGTQMGVEIGHFLVLKEVSNVPEPATTILFGIGLIGLAGFSRQKK